MANKKPTKNKKGQGVSLNAAAKLPEYGEFIGRITEERTRSTYNYAIGKWALFLSGKDVDVEDSMTWTDVLVSEFSDWLFAIGFKMSSISCYISAVNRYFRYLNTYDMLSFKIEKSTDIWKTLRGDRYRAQADTRDADPEVPKIISYYDGVPLPEGDSYKARLERLMILRARAIVQTLYASAGRVSEVISLNRSDVRDGRLSECKIVGKGKKKRYLILTKDAQRAIAEYCKERDDNNPALFISHGRDIGKPLDRRSVWRIVNNAARELGINGFAAPHAFRHYRAQNLLKAGMSIDDLQEYLGHADIGLTRRVYAPETSLAKVKLALEKYGVDAATAIKNTELAE